MYTLAQFREIVRATLDLGDTDLTDLLVDDWLRDGAERCQSARQAWPFYEETWAFNAVSGDDTYTLAEIETASGTGYDIAEIRQIRGPSWELKWQDISLRDAASPQDGVRTGKPTHYSQWDNGDVVLFPQPTAAAETYRVRGYRKPKDWVADGVLETSDMPNEFDRPIVNWAIGRAYAHQDEPASALYYADMANLRLEELTKRYNDIPPALDLIMNGGNRRGAGLMDPRLPWE